MTTPEHDKCPVCGHADLVIAIVDQDERGDYIEAQACEVCGWENELPWREYEDD
jgi:transcription elongation factor Elf1